MPTVLAKKWYPGHYLHNGVDNFLVFTPRVKNIITSEDGRIFEGVTMYTTWSRLELTRNKFDFDKMEKFLDLLPKDKKAACFLSWQSWPNGPAVPCPADMVGKAMYDGGYRKPKDGRTWPFSTIHMESTMIRYLEFVDKFAQHFDSDPRLAFVTTAELPYDRTLQIGQFNRQIAHSNYVRMAKHFPKAFSKTVAGALGAWYPFGGVDARKEFADAIFQNNGGFGFPDLNVSEGENFRYALEANAGRWPSWQGVEWNDYLEKSRTGNTFPNNQLATANKTKTNFIWWLPCDRTKDGGHNIDEAIAYLRKNYRAGISVTPPSSIKPI